METLFVACSMGNVPQTLGNAYLLLGRMFRELSRWYRWARTYLPVQETQDGAEDPLDEDNGSPFQYSSLKNSVDRRSLAGYSPWCCKESDTTEHAHTVNVPYMSVKSNW